MLRTTVLSASVTLAVLATPAVALAETPPDPSQQMPQSQPQSPESPQAQSPAQMPQSQSQTPQTPAVPITPGKPCTAADKLGLQQVLQMVGLQDLPILGSAKAGLCADNSRKKDNGNGSDDDAVSHILENIPVLSGDIPTLSGGSGGNGAP